MSNSAGKVIVRFPPSPTGLPHIGNIRTFLFNYLFARKHGGEIFLRFEDTDRERSKKEHEAEMMYALKKLGITYDHGPFRQSERTEAYTKAIDALLASQYAYEGEESKDGSSEPVIRFKNPNKPITFHDAVRGNITIDTTDFGDFVIARSRTNPLYHLTVVVDDIDMGVTHVLRGADHITSTPRQILLFEALGAPVPAFAHFPMILGEDGKKLSKRHGAVSYQDFEARGYLPEAVVNYLALVGWNPGKGNNQEFFSLEELTRIFSLEGLQQSPAQFSYAKLDAINKHYMHLVSDDVVTTEIHSRASQGVKEFLSHATPETQQVMQAMFRERITVWSDIPHVCASDFAWLQGVLPHAPELLVWKKGTKEGTMAHLGKAFDLLSSVTVWNAEHIKEAISPYAEEVGRGDVLWPMRVALTGAERSPDPFLVAQILGKEETLSRLYTAKSNLMV